MDRITHISAALLLCARGTYAQQATQAGAGLGLRGATVRAGSHSAQTMTSHMFAPRVTRLCSLVRLISQKKYSIDRKPCRRNTHLVKNARYEGISMIRRENSDRGSLVPEHRQRCRRSDSSGDQRLRQRFPMYLSQGTMSRIASPPPTRLLRRFILPERAPTMNSRATSSVADQPKSLSLQMNRPEHTTAPLGSQVIEGVYAEGKEITTTGNDRPLASVTELRFSPDSKVNVLSKTSDPHSGEFSTRLQNINCPTPMVAPAVLFSWRGLG